MVPARPFFIGRLGWVAVQRLDLALFIDGKNNGVGRRVDIEADETMSRTLVAN
jgi:hypothetical protein